MDASQIFPALFMATALFGVATAATLYHVGDNVGWTVGEVNYTLWSETKDFALGDTIIFKYNNGFHNVLQVTGANFNTCNVTSPISQFFSGNDIFNIKDYGNFYYICGTPGHCQLGQKVQIIVHQPHSAPSPGPVPGQSAPGVSPSPSALPASVSSPPSSPATVSHPPSSPETAFLPPSSPPTPGSPPPAPPTPGPPQPASDKSPSPSPSRFTAPAPAPSVASSLHAVGLLVASMAVLTYLLS